MNTGVQRSGATPPAARTATTQAVGPQPGNAFGQGKRRAAASRWRTRSPTSPRRPSPTCTTSRPRSTGRWRCAARATCTCSCPARSAGAPRRRDTIRIARLAIESGLFPVFEAEHGEVTAVAPIRRPVPVEEYLRPQKRYAHLFDARRRGPTSSPRIQALRRPQHRAASGCSTQERDVMDKPFAITLDVGSSLANHTGAWRTERPVYVDRLPPCNDACPAGENVQALALPRRGGRLRGGVAADHGGQPVPRRHGPGLLPPVRDRVQPRRSSTRRSASTPSSGSSATRRSAQGWTVAGAGGAVRQARARRRRRARRAVRGLPPALLGHDVEIRDAGAAGRRHDALRHPALPAARATSSTPRSPRILDTGRHAASSTRTVDRPRGDDARRRLRRGVPRHRRAARPARLHPGRRRPRSPRRRLAAARRWRARSGRSSAGASSSTAAATPRWTRPHRPAARRRATPSSSTAAPATGCRPTTSRSRRRSRRACGCSGCRTITHADGGRLVLERMELDETGFPQPTGEFEELDGRHARARARPGVRPVAARRRRRRRGRRRRRPGRRRT